MHIHTPTRYYASRKLDNDFKPLKEFNVGNEATISRTGSFYGVRRGAQPAVADLKVEVRRGCRLGGSADSVFHCKTNHTVRWLMVRCCVQWPEDDPAKVEVVTNVQSAGDGWLNYRCVRACMCLFGQPFSSHYSLLLCHVCELCVSTRVRTG